MYICKWFPRAKLAMVFQKSLYMYIRSMSSTYKTFPKKTLPRCYSIQLKYPCLTEVLSVRADVCRTGSAFYVLLSTFWLCFPFLLRVSFVFAYDIYIICKKKKKSKYNHIQYIVMFCLICNHYLFLMLSFFF